LLGVWIVRMSYGISFTVYSVKNTIFNSFMILNDLSLKFSMVVCQNQIG
jgi:hypothetical protein